MRWGKRRRRPNRATLPAIEIRFEGAKLGYVSASENELMSVMAFYGHADVFEARVIKLDPAANPWRQVCVGVYVTDAR